MTVLLAVAAALLLAGCSGGKPANTYGIYVGTWQEVGHPNVMVVIAKAEHGYEATWIRGGRVGTPMPLFPFMGELFSGRRVSDPFRGRPRYHFDALSAITMYAHMPVNGVLDMFSLSNSTAMPTPSPS